MEKQPNNLQSEDPGAKREAIRNYSLNQREAEQLLEDVVMYPESAAELIKSRLNIPDSVVRKSAEKALIGQLRYGFTNYINTINQFDFSEDELKSPRIKEAAKFGVEHFLGRGNIDIALQVTRRFGLEDLFSEKDLRETVLRGLHVHIINLENDALGEGEDPIGTESDVNSTIRYINKIAEVFDISREDMREFLQKLKEEIKNPEFLQKIVNRI